MATSHSDTQITTAIVMAGIPQTNASLYRRIRFLVGDPTALIEFHHADGRRQSLLILRDIEMARARQHAHVDRVACPADFTPPSGLSGDRETATAQAVAQCLRQAGVQEVIGDRTLPLIYADLVRDAGVQLRCDLELGVADRRQKDAQEIAWLREAQAATEGAMEMACRMVGRATADADGCLVFGGEALSSESVRQAIDLWLLARGYENPVSIVAGGPDGADCHHRGTGRLRTGQPVIIDIFPRNRDTLYYGDCTRTVVHGTISDDVRRMHQAVVAAKAAATATVRAGVTGEAVHQAALSVIQSHGFRFGRPQDGDDSCAMTHGTGHGIGLDVHESPLLDINGPELVVGDALTIEPGLYDKRVGGVRVEDMVIVGVAGCESLNHLPEGLDWS